MSNFAEEPLTKVTLNLFSKDVKFLQEHFGQGYSVEIRKIVRKKVMEMKRGE